MNYNILQTLLDPFFYIKGFGVFKVNWGLEGTSDIMVTPKPSVASILQFNIIIQKPQYSERVGRNQRIAVDQLRVLRSLYNKVKP